MKPQIATKPHDINQNRMLNGFVLFLYLYHIVQTQQQIESKSTLSLRVGSTFAEAEAEK